MGHSTLIHTLALLTHSLAPPYSLHSRVSPRSFACSFIRFRLYEKDDMNECISSIFNPLCRMDADHFPIIVVPTETPNRSPPPKSNAQWPAMDAEGRTWA